MLNELLEQLKTISAEAVEALAQAKTEADVEAVKFTVTAADLTALRLEADKKYQVVELMSGKVITGMTGAELQKKGIDLTLDAYQGVILKFNTVK